MFSLPFTEAFKISLPPFPPEAIAAIFNLSLGEMKPEPPNTCLGTIKIEDAKTLFFIKSLLFLLIFLFIQIT